MASWPSDVAKKKRGLYNHAGSKEEEVDTVVGLESEVQVNPKPAGNTRRRRTTGGSGTRSTVGGAGRAAALITSAGSTGGSVAAPAAAGAGRAASKCANNVSAPVKEEDVQAAAAAAEGKRGVAGINGKKSRRSPAVLMEGSRCSRVNGRGWRCCQQTLVGYSLCEHHLGKGRLRSVSSVRPNGGGRRKEEATDGAAAPSSPQLSAPMLMQQKRQARQLLLSSGDVDGDYVVEEEENPGNKRRRTKKIGMVKARSISSLLQYQPNYTAPTLAAAAAAAAEQCSAPSLAPVDTGNNYSGSCTS